MSVSVSVSVCSFVVIVMIFCCVLGWIRALLEGYLYWREYSQFVEYSGCAHWTLGSCQCFSTSCRDDHSSEVNKTWTHMTHTHTCTHKQTNTDTHTHKQTYTHTHTHTQTDTHTTHTHTHTTPNLQYMLSVYCHVYSQAASERIQVSLF